jgi:hypothetical protein
LKSILRRRPSPALVISCVALFVSLGGVSYGVATGFIDSREIQNNTVSSKDLRNNTVRTFDLRNNEVRGFDIRNSTVQGRDVALNTLTGADVSERDLDKVPSAIAADSAVTAGSANGVTPKPFSYAAQAGSGFVEVLNLGGLRLEAACGMGMTPILQVRASTAASNSELSSTFPGAAPGNEPDLDVGETVLVANNAPAALGHVVYANPGGHVVTIQGETRQDSNEVLSTTNDCGFFGMALAN